MGAGLGVQVQGESGVSKNSKEDKEGELEKKEKIDVIYEEDDETVLAIVDDDDDDESVHDRPEIEVK